MNTAHRPAIFETRFLNDGPEIWPRTNVAARLTRALAKLVVVGCAVGAVIVAALGAFAHG